MGASCRSSRIDSVKPVTNAAQRSGMLRRSSSGILC
jgi:hypothetical protein